MPRRADTARARVTTASTADHAAIRTAEMAGSPIKVRRSAKTAKGPCSRRWRAQRPRLPTSRETQIVMMIPAIMGGTSAMHWERRQRQMRNASAYARTCGGLRAASIRMLMRAGIKPAVVGGRARRESRGRGTGALLARDTTAGTHVGGSGNTLGRLTRVLTLQVDWTQNLPWASRPRANASLAR